MSTEHEPIVRLADVKGGESRQSLPEFLRWLAGSIEANEQCLIEEDDGSMTNGNPSRAVIMVTDEHDPDFYGKWLFTWRARSTDLIVMGNLITDAGFDELHSG